VLGYRPAPDGELAQISPFDDSAYLPQNFRTVVGQFVAKHFNGTCCGGYQRKQHADSGAFAGPILPQKAIDIAGVNRKREIVNGFYFFKLLYMAGGGYEWLH